MVVPALIYAYFNRHDSAAMAGWAIPAATDIAFALGVLTLLGSRVPTSIKIFLTSLAIFDDLGAILIIAFFYTEELSFAALLVVGCCVLTLILLQRLKAESMSVFVFIGIVMWVATVKSGVHATLAGVVLAVFIPIKSKTDLNYSPLKSLEQDLHAVVAYFVLPIFAFANAGVNLTNVNLEQALHNVPVGIALGLFVGKQAGVFGTCWLAIRLRLTRLPSGMSWATLYGTSALCGIGFTMSLFIGSLAFEQTGVDLLFNDRLGIIVGSLAAGLVGFTVLTFSLPKSESK